MSGDDEDDQCPFCNAAWGDCLHVKLLADLDNEATARSEPELSGDTSSASNVNTPDNVPAKASEIGPPKKSSGSG